MTPDFSYTKYFPSKFTEISMYAVRIILLVYLTTILGFLYALIITISAAHLFRFTISTLLGLDNLNIGDKIFVFENGNQNVTVGGVLHIDDYDYETIRKQVKERLFYKIPKLSSKLVQYFGEFFWDTPRMKNIPQEERDRIAESRIRRVKVKEEKGLKEYLQDQINLPLCIFECPIEFHLIEIEEDGITKEQPQKGCLLLKLDHTFSDGMGIIGMIGFLDNEFDINKYPEFMRKKLGWSFYLKAFIDYLLAPTLGLIWYIRYSIEISKQHLKYKPFYDAEQGTRKASKVCRISDIASFDLEPIKAFGKRNKTTLNDLIVYSLFKTLKKISPDSKKILTLIPIGFSNLPTKPEEIELYNKTSGLVDNLQLPELNDHDYNHSNSDSSTNDKSSKYKIVDVFGALYRVRFLFVLCYVLSDLIPFSAMKAIQLQVTPELSVSNAPGATKELRIGRCKVYKVYPITNTSFLGIFVAMCSYMGQVHVFTSIDKAIDIDPDEFSRMYGQTLNNLTQGKEE
eukprot:CAMPEP_0170519610 /NCGR_PEP_ID=MMETSP0209-20121228/4970_1 /TAXON_ID=665100 ORGANISM="Litonotus pictus, Strain P1" /NCGR_SAMPLE_ID=MMETSP0209 /ASSEMBLY_ACC=CAM_ASM_000301 /LENGTH=512 /DNA_ID=CAMNT_0010805547 /DNA_START=19 /DNA_END=1557 /DNA_ORIENTATION=-